MDFLCNTLEAKGEVLNGISCNCSKKVVKHNYNRLE